MVASVGETTLVVQRPGRLFLLLASLVVLVVAVGVVAYLVWRSIMPTVASLPSATDSPRWQFLASMPTARRGLALAAYENTLCAVGGHTGVEVTDVTECYDPVLDTWQPGVSKPTAMYNASAAVLGGKIYIPGGELASGSVTDVLEIYDPREDSWSKGASLPAALSAYALAAFEGRLYVFGGWDGKNSLDSVYEYDPEQDLWTVKTPMPTARRYAGAAWAGRKIYVIGGLADNQALRASEIYQPDLDDPQAMKAFWPGTTSR